MGGSGSAVGDVGNGHLPNIKGTVGTHNHSLSNLDNVLFKGGQYGSTAGLSGVGSFPNIAYFDASGYNGIYDDSYNEVIPSCLIVGGYVVKYI